MKLTLPSLLVGILLFILLGATMIYANITATQPQPVNVEHTYTFFATSTNQAIFSTSTTAQSTSINSWIDSNGRIDTGSMNIAGAKKVTFYFAREGKFGNAGSSAFDIDVSPDGVTWYDYTKLLNATSSTPTSFTAITLVGTSTSVISMDLTNSNFFAVRCNVTETTDGEHFCKAQVDY